ncbi:RNase P modulator RnpM [Caldisalinibacter kiritimatiensis]|uniref:Putative nucleic-acid-binding protein implicated in transcription termination n=1 Tax=Caldisalinibacter kiritimatiensis TaxID=1304284 RepID=R1CPM6_9FIRM|nr:YlxR family protein [Caldisalinibacter kiritimatiensis]EOD00621.1 Putative nucleic-acid-binding protein implicated in transcription termination [Caldisalinibacter kiritimatiensis]
MKKRKIPLRKCLGCNESKSKRELIRVVRNKEGEVSIDLTGKASGRGAYICNDLECLEKAQKSNRLSKALKIQVPEEIYEKLKMELDEQ